MTPQATELIEKNYKLAYKIAYSFNAPHIGEDVKENIAFKVLQRAAEKYDSTKGSKFTSFLYLCIMNELKTEAVRVSKQPRTFANAAVDTENDEAEDIFNTLETRGYEEADMTQYKQLMQGLNEKLTPRQKVLVNAFLSPEVFLEQYKVRFNLAAKPKKLSYKLLSKVVGVSGAMITQELKKIRKITQQIVNTDK